MTDNVQWLPDGTPYSSRFGDRYHSVSGTVQAREVFLRGCGLPQAWARRDQWRILETGFGFGLNFLTTWQTWKADPDRPRLLHFVSTEAWPVRAEDLEGLVHKHPDLAPQVRELQEQWWGLTPGVHRLAFEGGQVLLTLYIGDAQTALRQQSLEVDSVYLDGFSPRCNPDIWDLHTLKAVARCCRRGTRLATWTVARTVREALAQCGFEVHRAPGVPPKRENLHAVFNPHWEPRHAPTRTAAVTPQSCMIIGAGLAGAATAASLARRGWSVQVLDQGPTVAAGASGLPAGVFAPHVSPDDSLLSRLTRAGVRTTLWNARQWLEPDQDWAPTGVLEHRTDGTPGLPAGEGNDAARQWTTPAPASARAAAHLPNEAVACWHHRGGWIRPARLVQTLLAQPGITWCPNSAVARLRRVPATAQEPEPIWQALDSDGAVLAQAPWVVIAAGSGSPPLLENRWPLHPVRGQVCWGTYRPGDDAGHPLAPFPVNGHGNTVPSFGVEGCDGHRGWVMGSSFERGQDTLPPSTAEVQEASKGNWHKLQTLLPQSATHLSAAQQAQWASGQVQPAHPRDAAQLDTGRVYAWAGVRCTSPDRLPVVGPVDDQHLPGLWVCTAMGARGLTLSLLCAELLAARWHAEPLAMDTRLARALGSERLSTRITTQPSTPPAA